MNRAVVAAGDATIATSKGGPAGSPLRYCLAAQAGVDGGDFLA